MAQKKRWLVTGGAGFIGSHITETLIKKGHFVRVLDNFFSGKEENLAFANELSAMSYELIRGDIRDKATCEKACEGIDYISHQAALRSVPKSMESPHDYNAVNIDGTLNLLEAAAKAKVKRLVMASSSSVYGDVTKFPEKETFFPELISPYALSKLAGEYYCRIFSEFFGVETVCLRYFNVFGPRQALDDEYAVVIPKFTTCILNDEQPPIFGTGKQSRDFTYIDNVVQANIKAATVSSLSLRGGAGKATTKQSPKSVAHAVVNIANGKDNTVLELVAALNKIIGKNVKPKLLPVRTGDVFRTSADISRAKKLIGYKPTISFEEGLRKVVKYWEERISR